jgi:hypothetical protein
MTPANNSVGVLPTATISTTFSETVDPSTITFLVQDSFNNVVSGNLQYDAATHTATFVPSTALLSFRTYTATVSGAKDLSGNTLAAPTTVTFRTRGIWLQTSFADFSAAGTSHNGTVATNNAGGEIELAPLLSEQFAGTSLNSTTWTSQSWASQGGGPASVTVADGVLTLGGSAVLSAQSYTNTGLEGRISFGAARYQHFGLVTSFDTVAGSYWAMFSTGGTTDYLYARVNANGATTDQLIGALPAGFHNYKIVPLSGGFEFYIDGVLQTTIAATFQTTVPMKAGLSDYLGVSGQLLQADSVAFQSYATAQTGTFTSTTFDAGQTVTWDAMNYTATVPTGTTLAIEVYVSNDGVNWQLAPVQSNGTIGQSGNAVTARYLRYVVTMSTTDPTKTPRLSDISFTWI